MSAETRTRKESEKLLRDWARKHRIPPNGVHLITSIAQEQNELHRDLIWVEKDQELVHFQRYFGRSVPSFAMEPLANLRWLVEHRELYLRLQDEICRRLRELVVDHHRSDGLPETFELKAREEETELLRTLFSEVDETHFLVIDHAENSTSAVYRKYEKVDSQLIYRPQREYFLNPTSERLADYIEKTRWALGASESADLLHDRLTAHQIVLETVL